MTKFSEMPIEDLHKAFDKEGLSFKQVYHTHKGGTLDSMNFLKIALLSKGGMPPSPQHKHAWIVT
jgi:hypothetical protein